MYNRTMVITKWIMSIIFCAIIFVGAIVYFYGRHEESHPRPENEIEWCERNGGKYFMGGLGAGHCEFLPNNN